jgi:hypothetical protein
MMTRGEVIALAMILLLVALFWVAVLISRERLML